MKKLLAASILLVFFLSASAQTPGLIYEPSSGSVLDPNGDGYTSLTNQGFQFNDQTESEIPFVKMIFPGAEPFGDLTKGPTGGFGDFVDSGVEDPAQYYFDGTNFVFRLRIGSGAPNSKGYSILIDTDGKFGYTGENADPDADVNNPGFEVEVSLQSNFGVFVYNIDGSTCPVTAAVSHAGTTHYQKSFALSTITGSINSFYDFYIPFSDLTGLGLGITSATPMRMVIATNTSPNPSICSNGIADVGGIDDSACGSLFGCLVDIIDNYTPTSPDDVENGEDPLDRSNCPTLSGSITDGATSVTVTTTGLTGTVLKVYDLSGPTEIGSFTTTVDNFSGSVTVTAVATGDVLGATATEPGKSESINNCSSQTVIDSCVPGTGPTLDVINNGAGDISGTVSTAGTYDLRIYNADGTLLTGGTDPNPKSITIASAGGAFTYSYGSGATKVPPGAYYATIASGGCESLISNIVCEGGTGTSVTPTITSPATILESTTTIEGSATNGASVSVWIDGEPSSFSATAGSGSPAYSISVSGLSAGESVTVVAVDPDGGDVLCQAASSALTVQGDPITSDNPPAISETFCITSGTVTSVSGTSVEADGTTIQLYKNSVAEGGTTTVTSGTWTVNTGISFAIGDVITATATVSGGSESAASSSVTVQQKTTNAVAITTDPVEEGVSTISGTGTDGDVISLFVDGLEVSITKPTVGSAVSGQWTITGLSSFVLYSGAQVTVTATSSGRCESDQSAAVEVSCKAPTAPSVTSSDVSYCNGSSGEYTLTTSETLVLYEMVDNTGGSLGIQAIGTGSSITLLSDPLTSDVSNVFIRATSLFDASCFSASSSSFNFTPADPAPSVDLTSTNIQVVSGSTSANLAYTNAQNSPTNYSIDFSILAENQGFVDVSSTALGASPFSVTVPGAAAEGTYPATLTITGGSSCESQYSFSIEIYGAGAPASISTQPTDVSKCAGEGGSFSVTATNAQSYQWQVDTGSGFSNLSDGGVYSGVTTANLSIADVSGLGTNQYRVNVTGFDAVVVTSSSATLNEVTISPGSIGSDQTINSGDTPSGLTSTVDATGTSVSYQWKVSEDNISFSNISGATSSTFSPGALTTTTYYKREATSTVSGHSCSDESNVVTITVTGGTATKLAFTTQPISTTGGATMANVVVTIQDAGSNTVTSATDNVTLAIGANPGSGSLSGTLTVAAVNGVATFSGLSIDKIGTGYTLTANASGLTGATSNTFNITLGTASQLVFTTQPGNGTGGSALSTQPVVTIQDAGGNTVTTATDNITLSINANPGSGSLSGTATVAAVSGVATFSGLSIDKVGTGYTLDADGASLTTVTSNSFNITVGTASQLAFTTQPGNGTGGSALSTQPVVTIQDAGGNTVTTATDNITLSINANPGSGSLSGTATVAAVSGVATFSGLSIDKVGTGYTLDADGASLTTVTSNSFNITVGTASQLAFTTQPGNGTGGSALSTQPVVTIQDAGGNTVTTATDNITLSINANPGSGSLSGTATVAAVSGVATFSGLSIDKVGTGYTLDADGASLTTVTSSTFNITVGTASQLVFTTQPGNGTGGSALSTPPVVTIQDAGGNTVTTATDNITLSINANPGSGSLSGTATVAAVSGVATFSGLSIDKVGTGYTLDADGASLTTVTSNSFNITVGTASQLAFTTQPSNTSAGGTMSSVVVTIQDAGGNTVTGATDNVTLAINNNPSSGTLSGTTTVAAVSGVATFSTLSIDAIGSGYTLDATASGLSTATSNGFNITGGTATKLAFTTQPISTTGGATMSNVVVTIQDAGNNTVTSATDNVTLAIGANPGSGSLSGTLTVAAVNGVATFSGLSIDKIGTGYTLTANASGLTGATSNTFNITLGTASQLAFTTQPGNGTGGSALSTQPVVTIQDAGGNTVTTATDNITLSINANPGSGSLSGTATVAAVSGVATFSGLSIDKVGTGYTLDADGASLTTVTSSTFNITVGTASQLVFTTQPGNGTGGSALSTQPVVTIQDAGGNTVTTATDNITLSINANPGSGSLSGTATVAAVSGVATFSGLSIDKVGTGYTLDADGASLTTVTSNSFNITVGTASQLVFTTQPGNGTGGSALSTQPVVTIQDAGGNTVTTATDNITLSINANPGSGSLSGTATVAAVSGVATFSGLSIDKVGTGYTLDADGASLTTVTSNSFNITVGTASQLVFTTQPGNGTGGSALSTQPVVTIQDAGGNTVTTATDNITLSINANPGSGSLSGTATVAAVSGVATFSGLSIDKVGTGYTLDADGASLTTVTSNSFNITVGTASQLAFTTQPGNGTGGSALSTQPVVTIQDAGGNTVTTATDNITLSINANPGSGSLSGTATVAAVSGVATFSGLSIDKVGTGYTLDADGASLTTVTSNSFNITVGTASQLVFTTQPGNGTGGSALSTQPVVTIQDAGGNTVTTATDNITLSINANPGSGSLSGTATVAAVSGVATFSGLSIDKVGTGYTLDADGASLTTVTSNSFNITVGTASQLVFTTQPGNGTGGSALSTQPVVTIQDAGGNTVTTATDNITLSINANPGSGSLSGTATVAAVSGVATFSGLSIDKVGTGYTLDADGASLTTVTSNSFNITVGTASQLVFTTQPGNGTGGSALSTQPVVTIQDAGGNTVTTATDNITLSINANPGSGSLSGTATVAAVSGVATFSGLSIDKVGTGYTLDADGASLTTVTSNSFNITVGTASQLAFTTQPGNGTGGSALSTQPVVTIQDAGGNTVTTATDNITLSINANPGSGSLSGTATVAAVSGVATFSGLSIDKVGTGYTLDADGASLTTVTSNSFNITVGTASQLAFTTQPGNGTGGSALSTQPVVTIQDAGGNTVTTATDNITLSINANPGSGSLSGTATVAAVSGVATFSGLSIDKVGTGYTLDADGASLTTVTSSTFNITVGTASQLVFTTQPGNGTGGSALSTPPVVTIQDAGGNTVTTATDNITLSINANPGSGSLSGTATVAAVSGVATFSGLSIDKVGTGYTLDADGASLTTVTSNSFNITVGTASQLAFTTQPSNTSAGGTMSSVVVTIQDAGGNTVTGATDNVTLAINNNPSSGTLSGTTTVAAVSGVATFSTLSIDAIGSGYTLDATASGLSTATSNGFNITGGTATKLAFTTQPISTTGGATMSNVVVTIQDAGNNTVTSATDNVTLAIGANPGSGSLSGTLTVAAVNGVATFSGLSIDKIGTGYTLTANASGLTGATSNTFNITLGTASQLAFTTQPGNGTGGSALSTQPVVTIQDAGGNTVTTATDNITLSINANPGSGSLSGTATVAAVSGVATFSGLSIDKVGTGYTLDADGASLTTVTSNSFNITVGTASQLVFTTQPGNGTGGSALSTQPVVTIQDAGGNTVTTATDNITLSINANPGSGSLSGTATVAAVSGVATFSGLSIDKVGTGYTLDADGASLTTVTSNSFNITVGTASQLAFTTQPGNGTGGSALSTQPVVTIQDAGGNTVTTATDNITLSINANPGSGSLSGTATVAAVSGVATFSGLSIDKVGTGYTLDADGASLTTVTSNSFNITVGTASQLAFTTQPGNGTGGSALSTQPVVTIQDAGGNTVTTATDNITLSINANPGSGSLSGTATVAAVSGVATFSGLSIDKVGTGYTLDADGASLTTVTSSTFNITVGTASQLVFTTQPGNGTGGSALSTPPVVTIQDAGGNTVTTATDNITLSINANPGSGSLSGTATVAAVSGVATFSGLSIDKVGTGYTLDADGASLTTVTSNSFNITVGTASQLAFTTQPSNTSAGGTMSSVVVTIQDAGGNTVTGATDNVTLAINNNPSSGTLSGTTTVAAVSGVATFSTLSIDAIGSGYTLDATASGLSTATSNGFNITGGTATKLAFTTQPISTTGGATMSNVVVTIQDAGNNTVTSATDNVTLAIGANPGSGSLSGTLTVAAVNGVATFSGLSIDKIGTGYTLTANASGLTGATSNTFNITLGTASQLAFTTQPGNGTGGSALSTQPVVTIQDAGGNTVTTATDNITLSINANPGSGSLSGTATVAAVSGVATFSGLSIDKVGTGYTLDADGASLTTVTSSTFNITVGTASQLVFTTQPGNGTGGSALSTQPVVTIQDAGGNTVTTATDNITLSINANPGSGSLSGTATVAAVSGVATFSGLSIDKVGTGYTLDADGASLTTVTSNSFNITVGTASQLVFTTQPGNGTGGSALSTQPVVTIQDAGGNTVTTATDNITLSINANPGSGSLSGTATVAAVSGVATFSGLSIDKVGTGYTLDADGASLTTVTSNSFNITVGTASQLVFTTQPGNGTGGSALSTQPVVTIQDAGGNTVTTATDNITLSINANPGSGSLSGTATVAAVSGVATFSGLSIDKVGTGYTLDADGASLTTVTSNSFNITVGTASQLAFTTQPGNGTGGSALSTQPVVTIQDAGGNTVTTATDNITLSINANPGSGSLSGTATVAAVSGVATFSGLSIDKVGTGYTLDADGASLTTVTSNSFNITVGTASQLAFTTQPGNGTGGSALSTQPVVTIQDAGGNTVTTATDNITLSINANPGSGSLSGTATVAAVSGVATFSGLSIDKVGTGYTLDADGASLTTVTSSTFNITVGTASQLVFTTQPGNGTGGSALSTPPVVTIQDAGGNTVTTATDNITLSINANPGSGSLSGTATVAAVSGVATFSGLSIDKVGTGYTLDADGASLTTVTSNSFNITVGTASQLAFTTQPSNTSAGGTMSSVVVTIQDAGGNTVTGATDNVTLAINNNPSSGTLSGTTTVAAVSGVATFSTLSIDAIGSGYTLDATASGLSTATSNGFNITGGTATKLAFTTQPISTTGGATMSNVVVTIQDAGNNTVTSATDNVTLAIGANPGSGSLSGTLTVAAVNGVATFSGLSIDKIGTGYTLTANASGLTGATSNTFNITLGTASQLAFTTQPGNGTGGSALSTQPVVTIQDAGGNTVTTATDNITLSINANPGSGSLSGTATVAAVSGVATFSGLSIDKVGTGYTLDADGASLTTVTSSTFNITVGTASQLVFTTQPGNGTGGSALSTQPVVTIQDAGGNTVTTATDNITLSINANPGSGSLSGTATVAAVSGVATFSGLSIDKVGTGYTLDADGASLTTVTSSTFNITVGTASQLVFTTQPSNTSAGGTMSSVVVTIQDAGGNTVTGATDNVTLAINNNPSSGTLSGTTTVAAVSGVATFSTLSIDAIGSGYTLDATASGLSTATSNGFNMLDTTPPVAPTITSLDTNDTTPTVSGTAEAGSSVSVTVDGTVYNTTADASGNWSIVVTSALAEGTYDVSVRSTDASSNSTDDSTTDELTIDTTSPIAPTITSLDTNDTTPTVSGTAEAGSSVSVTVDGTVYNTTADASGNWSIVVTSALAEGTYDVSVTSTDASSNSTDDSTTDELTIDTTSPIAPTITSLDTNDTTPTVSGTAEAGSSVSVTVDGTVYNTTADASGNWSIVVTSALAEGTYDVSVRSTDASSNSTDDSTTDELTIDTTSPIAPTITSLDTNDTTPTVSGTAEAGSSVSVTIDGTVYNTTTDASGNWSIVVTSALAEGTYDVSVRSTDASSNSTDDSTTDELTIDTTSPIAPTITSLDTNDTTPTVSGTAEAGSSVSVTIDGTVYNTTADASGNWSIVVTNALAEGTYDVSVTSTDASSNSTDDSTTDELTIDTTSPIAPTITSLDTNDTTPTVSGTAEAGSSVSVTIDGTVYNTTADASGNWSIVVTNALAEGTYDVSVTSTDASSNSTDDSTTDELTIDTTSPIAPTITSLDTNDTTPTVSGTAEAGSSVSVTIDGTVYNTTADASGNWSIVVTNALAEGTYDVSVTSTDASSNSTDDSTTDELTIDTTSPIAPTITSLDTNDTTPTVSGTAEAGSSVSVTIDGTVYNTTADASGNWSIVVTSALAEGTYDVSVASTDNVGNTNTIQAPGALVIRSNDDTDGDGINDEDEDTNGDGDLSNDDCDDDGTPNYLDTDPCDTDGDGFDDEQEDTDGDGNPYNDDCDGDGVPNFQDPGACDTDGDGINDEDEDTNGDGDLSNDDCDDDGTPNYLDTDPCDTDGDGFDDEQEDIDGDGNPYNDDCDGDGVPNFQDPGACDTDGDGINDEDEDTNGDGDLSNDDCDDDGTPNYLDTDPCDTDGDGFDDEQEDIDGDGNPYNDDCDGDGIPNFQDPDQCEGQVVINPMPGFTPDGNSENDFFFIEGIENFPGNNVQVFNRWGNKIFEVNGYDNQSRVWRGQADFGVIPGAKEVPDGTYFYLINLGDGSKPLSGFVVIKK